ncbi:hypothetical protein F2Q69_00001026 [Brassica cretica]|uniref:FBD domain-containing protein n=1 Tax=Brassica cretica TaxID=69181 RepID=A0A8S9PE55_BRACR|nr:hypothetical protein F2Q69_00001026 [Brassica cretica]
MTPQTLSSKGNLHHPGPQEVVNPLQGHRYADAVVVIVVVVLHLGDLLGQRLELNTLDFTNDQLCVDFIHEFLAFQGKHYLREFKLTIDHDGLNSEVYLYKPCLGKVLDMRKLERFQFQVENKFGAIDDIDDVIRTPLTLSACEALVCLKLHHISLDEFVSLSLPCLKIMFLEDVVLPSDAAAENKAESLKVDIDVEFELMSDYLSETKIICNLVQNFSGVKDMTISWKTLEELVIDSPYAVSTRLSTVLPRCLLSSLESVEMETPVTEIATELSLARYFMKNSKKLKKLVLRLDESTGEQHKPGVLERLVKYSRRCKLSQFEVLPVVPTPSPWPGYVHVKSNRF